MKKVSESILAGFSVLTIIILLSAANTIYAGATINKVAEPVDSINANIIDGNVAGVINAGITSRVIEINRVESINIDSVRESLINRNISNVIDGDIIMSRVIEPTTIDSIGINSINAIRVESNSIAVIDPGSMIGVIARG